MPARKESYIRAVSNFAVQDDHGRLGDDGANLRERCDAVVGSPRTLSIVGSDVPGRGTVPVDRSRATVRREDVESATHAVSG